MAVQADRLYHLFLRNTSLHAPASRQSAAPEVDAIECLPGDALDRYLVFSDNEALYEYCFPHSYLC